MVMSTKVTLYDVESRGKDPDQHDVEVITADAVEVELTEPTSTWVTVGNLSVYIKRTDEGVIVDVYPLNSEMDNALNSMWVLFSEAEEEEED